jgi:hypothetical protein
LSTVRLPKVGHGLARIILATVAVIFALDWAQSFVISLLLGVLFAYTLTPWSCGSSASTSRVRWAPLS